MIRDKDSVRFQMKGNLNTEYSAGRPRMQSNLPGQYPESDPRRESVSYQMFERFQRRRNWRRFVALAYISISVFYLAWRFTIVDPHSLTLSYLFLAGEIIGFILVLSGVSSSWSYRHRAPLPVPRGLTVDILIPVYKEPVELVRRTVMAAKSIEYPHNTFVLDDGKSEAMKSMVEGLGVRYLRRSENVHAKAGNLNFGLQHSTADFFMTFDADHIALPHALDVMLGYFADPNVAMVQTPQDFYNVDAFQYMNSKRTGGLWHDQSYFYNLSQPCNDNKNASSCVGTGFVCRRSALDAIGGIPVETLTEDVHTSLKLHKKGYQIIYMNEPIAYGVAAADMSEYYRTRHRWGHGNLQALRAENILTCKGLSFSQRWAYLGLGLIYLEGWQQLLFFSITPLALFLNLPLFQNSVFNVWMVLFFPLLTYAAMQEYGCGFVRTWTNEMFAMARWPVYVLSTAGLFGKKMPWRSSSKNIKAKMNWRLVAPQLAVLTVHVLALAYGVKRVLHHFELGPFLRFLHDRIPFSSISANVDVRGLQHRLGQPGAPYTLDLLVFSGGWALYTVIRVLFFLRKVLRDARCSHEFFRFKIPIPSFWGADRQHKACIISISEVWARVALHDPIPNPGVGAIFSWVASLPSGPIDLKMRIEKVTPQASGKGVFLEGDLVWDSTELQDQLSLCLYSVDWHREFMSRSESFLVPSDIVRSLLHFRSPLELTFAPWRAVMIDGRSYGMMGVFRQNLNLAELVAFVSLSPGSIHEIEVFSERGTERFQLRVDCSQPIASLAKKGLDGAVVHRYRVELQSVPYSEALREIA